MPPTPPPADPLQLPAIRALIVFGLLLGGMAMWLQFGAIEWAQGAQRWGMLGVAVLALIPPVARPLGRALLRVRRFSPGARWATAAVVFLASAGTTLSLNLAQGADLDPSVCDEYSYLIQAQLLAHGRLWSAAHAHPDFFTTFQLIAEPVYGSIYFPGTALWIAPFSMLRPDGSLAFIGPWLAAALAVTLVFLITSEMLDELAGLLAAFLTFSVPIWRGLSMVIMGQCIAAALGLLLVWIFLRWRSAARGGGDGTTIRPRRALLLGAAAGFVAAWAMLSRPVDGLAYSLPVVVGVLLARGIPFRLRALSIAAAVAGAMPLLAMQISFNRAVTGERLRTPFSWYNDKYLPGTTYAATEVDESELIPSAQKTAHFHWSYQNFTRPFVEDVNTFAPAALAHERLRLTMVAGTTHGMTLIWLPFALLLLIPPRGLPDSARPAGEADDPSAATRRVGGWDLWLMVLPFVLMWLLYLPYGFFLYQYSGAAVPSIAFTIVAGSYAMFAFAAQPVERPSGPPWWHRALPLAGVAAAGLAVWLIPDLLEWASAVVPLIALTRSWSFWVMVAPLAFFAVAPWIWQRQRGSAMPSWLPSLVVFGVLSLVVLGSRGLPGFYYTQSEDWYRVPELRQIDRILEEIPDRAIVFVTPPGSDAPPEADAVYNVGVVSPDLARVIRAHDMGVRNIELIRYYARVQPERRAYHYHRRTRRLTDLGNVAELAALPEQDLQARFEQLSLPWRSRYAWLLSKRGYHPSQFPFEAPDPALWSPDAEHPSRQPQQSPATEPSSPEADDE